MNLQTSALIIKSSDVKAMNIRRQLNILFLSNLAGCSVEAVVDLPLPAGQKRQLGNPETRRRRHGRNPPAVTAVPAAGKPLEISTFEDP